MPITLSYSQDALSTFEARRTSRDFTQRIMPKRSAPAMTAWVAVTLWSGNPPVEREYPSLFRLSPDAKK
jgi:hypothetical protein